MLEGGGAISSPGRPSPYRDRRGLPLRMTSQTVGCPALVDPNPALVDPNGWAISDSVHGLAGTACFDGQKVVVAAGASLWTATGPHDDYQTRPPGKPPSVPGR